MHENLYFGVFGYAEAECGEKRLLSLIVSPKIQDGRHENQIFVNFTLLYKKKTTDSQITKYGLRHILNIIKKELSKSVQN